MKRLIIAAVLSPEKHLIDMVHNYLQDYTKAEDMEAKKEFLSKATLAMTSIAIKMALETGDSLDVVEEKLEKMQISKSEFIVSKN